MGDPVLETRPVGPDDLVDLAALFDTCRNTPVLVHGLLLEPGQFAAGWLTGGNRRRFEAMATGGGPPMGIVASVSGEPVGWGACGPRSRYVAAEGGRTGLLRDRDRDENEAVWVLPYLFVGPGFRGQGVTYALIRAAVELAQREGARGLSRVGP